MALGQVSVTTKTVGVPTFPEPEGVGLFIGTVEAAGAASKNGALKAIGRETDLLALFGVADNLVDTIESARENGGPNWTGWAIGHINHVATIDNAAAVNKGSGKVGIPAAGHNLPAGIQIVIAGSINYNAAHTVDPDTTANEIVIVATFSAETFAGTETATAAEDWADVLSIALPACDPEFLTICKLLTAGSELTDLQTELLAQLNLHRRMFAIAAFRGYETVTDADWSAYLTTAAAITNAIVAARVMISPLVFGDELGSFAGRLQKAVDEADPKISRSPMRVASGSVVDPGAAPAALLDDTGAPLELFHLDTLDGGRFSVFQWHVGRQGIYFADGNLLAAAGSDDPAVIEWLRLLDKAARRIRLMMIQAIADDTLQNTPAGNAASATRFALPLRQMQGLREIQPLARNALTVSWPSINSIKANFKIRPPNAAKDITGEIELITTQE